VQIVGHITQLGASNVLPTLTFDLHDNLLKEHALLHVHTPESSTQVASTVPQTSASSTDKTTDNVENATQTMNSTDTDTATMDVAETESMDMSATETAAVTPTETSLNATTGQNRSVVDPNMEVDSASVEVANPSTQ
jgi:hypothetical protein